MLARRKGKTKRRKKEVNEGERKELKRYEERDEEERMDKGEK